MVNKVVQSLSEMIKAFHVYLVAYQAVMKSRNYFSIQTRTLERSHIRNVAKKHIAYLNCNQDHSLYNFILSSRP